MNLYKQCTKLPITIGIQYDKKCVEKIDQYFQNLGIKNKVCHHISVKYICYEENISQDYIDSIVSKLRKEKIIDKRSIALNKLCILKSTNAFFSNMLYILPSEDYIKEMHYRIISILKEDTDIFWESDMGNFMPHISCGKIKDYSFVDKANQELFNTPLKINEWYLCLHTSKKEYYL